MYCLTSESLKLKSPKERPHLGQKNMAGKKKSPKNKTKKHETNTPKRNSALINTCRGGGGGSCCRSTSSVKSRGNVTHSRTRTTETGRPLGSPPAPNYLHPHFQYTLAERQDWTSADHLFGCVGPGLGWNCGCAWKQDVICL